MAELELTEGGDEQLLSPSMESGGERGGVVSPRKSMQSYVEIKTEIKCSINPKSTMDILLD